MSKNDVEHNFRKRHGNVCLHCKTTFAEIFSMITADSTLKQHHKAIPVLKHSSCLCSRAQPQGAGKPANQIEDSMGKP